jgi:CRP/FNR family transcriptional regulator, cyclic AMP receptor protein
MSRNKTSLHYLKYADNFKTYAAGDVIFKEGDPGLFMYVVKDGKVELRAEGLLLETVQSGDIFGEMALIENSVRSATAVAATDCKVVPLDQDKFTYLVKQTPYFALEVLRIMAHRLRAVNKELARNTAIYSKPDPAAKK